MCHFEASTHGFQNQWSFVKQQLSDYHYERPCNNSFMIMWQSDNRDWWWESTERVEIHRQSLRADQTKTRYFNRNWRSLNRSGKQYMIVYQSLKYWVLEQSESLQYFMLKYSTNEPNLIDHVIWQLTLLKILLGSWNASIISGWEKITSSISLAHFAWASGVMTALASLR